MNEQPEFTLAEALDIADANADAYKGVRSVSRTLAAEVRRLRSELRRKAGNLAEHEPGDDE